MMLIGSTSNKGVPAKQRAFVTGETDSQTGGAMSAMDTFMSLMGRNGFLPHGYCFTWSPGLLWSMVTADAIIALAYFSIPLAIISYFRRRPEATTTRLAWLFSAFIFACGMTHVMDIWTIWQPDYAVQAISKIVTAAISLVTSIALWPLIPKALKIPSVKQLQQVIGDLEAEVGRRKSAEDQLVAIQQSLAVTLASIDAGFIATNREGKVTRMNAVAEHITGWTQREALGKNLFTVFEREDRPEVNLSQNPVDIMLDQGVTVDTVHRVTAVSRYGLRTPLELKADLTRDDHGQVTGLAMVFRDHSRIVQAETESSRLAAIVESSNDAIISKTLDGRITSWNRAAQSIFGYSAEEAIGQYMQILIPPDRLEEESRIIDSIANGQRVPAFDTVRLTSRGEKLHVQVAISPIKDGEGRVVGASKIARDITEQLQAESARLALQRLEAENLQIQEASRLKSQFLANMSHELRTPLNAVIGFADLLQAGYIPSDSPKYQEFLGHIGTSGRHLLQLINDVLDLSKVESGKFEFFPEPLNLSVLIQEVQDILHTTLNRKKIRMVVDIDPGLTDVSLDPARLKQVLYNYLSNAIKFTKPSGQVTVRAMGQGPEHFRIEVEDTGIGISAADLPRLFTDFQQLDAGYNKQHQGTGLGLALTRRLVQAQSGRVGVQSTLGVGSLFYVELNRRHGFGPYHDQDRVLVIEDDADHQALYSQALSKAGFDVDIASDSTKALQYARDRTYAALTLDLGLPDKRGLELLEGIRHSGASHASPVRGVSMPADSNLSATFAITNVLSKPIRSDEIVSAMTRLNLSKKAGALVMVIDDEQVSLDLMRATLNSINIEVVCFQDGRIALNEIQQHRPAAIVLDLMMPEFDGFQVLDALQHLPTWRDVPVFIWTSMLLTDEEYATLARSARAILIKGGGSIETVLEGLRRWRNPLLTDAQAQP